MTDLGEGERGRLMRAVFATESALRSLFGPDKVNLACFGNKIRHIHWHVIPRTEDDPHFPEPSWGEPRRAAPTGRPVVSDAAIASRLAESLDSKPRT
jgi:diadenosine tetraphosphate (Ap4A) HIT family hydrolase